MAQKSIPAKTSPATKKASPAHVTVQPYFNKEAITFLRGLKKNNDREWFNARKATYERELKEPMLAVIRKVTDAMLDFAPGHVRPAEKSLFRIYRDTRFSNNKQPYKTHVAAWWVRSGLEKTSGAGYYVQVSPEGVLIAGGAYMPEKEQLAAIRNWLLTNHAEFRKLLSRPAVKKSFSLFEGNALTRPPKGFDVEHPAIDLIRCRQWGLSCELPVDEALKPKFAELLVKHFKLIAPIIDALNTPLIAEVKPKRPLMYALK